VAIAAGLPHRGQFSVRLDEPDGQGGTVICAFGRHQALKKRFA